VAERNEQVMEMVVKELDKNPSVGLESLYARAKEIDSSVSELSLRQFHARYPLQVKRSRSRGAAKRQKGASPRKRAAGGDKGAATRGSTQRRSRGDATGGAEFDREKVRQLFLEFASEFAEAESRKEIVRVLSSVDSYVNRLSKVVANRTS
jgi:hypothetical protein